MPLSLLSTGPLVVVSSLPMTETEKAFLYKAGARLGARAQVLSIQTGGKGLVQPEDFPILQVSGKLADINRVKLLYQDPI